MLVTGPNGAGKTNLLESLHVGTQGFSPRTRADAQLVRFGREAARVALRGNRAGVPLDLEVILQLVWLLEHFHELIASTQENAFAHRPQPSH